MTPASASGHSRGLIAKLSLLGVTTLGTMSSNVVSVALSPLADDLQQSISTATLAVSVFGIVLATAVPIAGWLGDAIGMRRTLVAAIGLMLLSNVGAALAPTFAVLVVARVVQGLGCSAVPVLVLGLLVTQFPERRMRLMAAWATANGVGQVVGPALGGVVAELTGWRGIFWVMTAGSAVVLVGVLTAVAPHQGRSRPLHLSAASALCGGTAAVLVALTALAQPGGLRGWALALLAIGGGLLAGFLRLCRRPDPLIELRLLVEPDFVRSCLAVAGQMFVLGALLIATPLSLIASARLSTSMAGLVFMVLPVTMTLTAPIVGRSIGPRRTWRLLRIGLLVLTAGCLSIGLIVNRLDDGAWVLVLGGQLALLGTGMALVQTPAATLATGSPAGRSGVALGLFTTLRVSGGAAGAAWVAFSVDRAEPLLWLGCATAAGLALFACTLPCPPQYELPS